MLPPVDRFIACNNYRTLSFELEELSVPTITPEPEESFMFFAEDDEEETK